MRNHPLLQCLRERCLEIAVIRYNPQILSFLECSISWMFQTRREKILEARNKEIRLKEKTKVIKHCQPYIRNSPEDCCRECLDLEDLVGRKLEVLFLQHAFIHLAPSIHLFIALFFSFPLRDLDCATFEFLMKSSFDFAKCWQWYHPEKISSNSYSSSGRTGLKWWL